MQLSFQFSANFHCVMDFHVLQSDKQKLDISFLFFAIYTHISVENLNVINLQCLYMYVLHLNMIIMYKILEQISNISNILKLSYFNF